MIDMPRLAIRTAHVNARRRPLAEGGFALPAAIAVLLILSVLTGAAITVSSRTSSSTTRDNNVKAALEAAEAGLQVAGYRLSKLAPGKAECISAGEIKKSESECKSGEESLGNGASFKYWTTLPLAVKGTCAGQEVAKIESGATLRCVTSEGAVNGVKPGTRLRALVESKTGKSLFSVKGILGLEEVLVSGSVKVPSVVASNTLITSGGKGSGAFEKGFELCPGGKFTPAAGAERNASGVTVGGKKEDPELEITSSSGCPFEASLPKVHPTAAENEDERITNKLDKSTENKKGALKFTGSPKYELLMESEPELTLGGSKYYFCSVKLQNAAKLKIAAGASVEIFIDTHEDNANCPEGSGTFKIEGNARIENPNGPGSLLIEMAGKGPFTLENSGSLSASIFAPEAEVVLNGGTTFKGGIVGKKVHLTNGSGIFEWSEEAEKWTNGEPTGYSRKAWEQCTPGSGASEGC